jgi:Uma2 family endonuclease
MASAARKLEPMTIVEFDDFIETLGDEAKLYELVDGFIVMMSNPTERHEQIAGNIGAQLKLAMNKRGCRTYQGGMRVQRSAEGTAGDKTKPDVVVRCSAPNSEQQQRTFIDDPVVVVEVLSPSTMDYDRGPKLKFYKTLKTLQHIVIVYQDQRRIEHYRRGKKSWTVDDALIKPEDVLDLSAVAFTMTVDEAYFGVTIS